MSMGYGFESRLMPGAQTNTLPSTAVDGIVTDTDVDVAATL